MPKLNTYLDVPPNCSKWFILDVMKTGEKGGDTSRRFRPGRPRNIWVALLIDVDPDEFRTSHHTSTKPDSCWLALGRHPTRDQAWDFAEAMLATRH